MFSEQVDLCGRTIVLESGQIARQASGAVVVREGATFILATVVSDFDTPPRGDFLPLTVEYREKMAANRRIPGNYFRREGRITEAEVLTSRLIDRTLRPLVPKFYRQETQVAVTVYSADPKSDLETLGLIAASAAMQISEVPFSGPVAGLRVGRIGGTFSALMGRKEMQKSDIDVIVSASREGLVMAEGSLELVPDADLGRTFDTAIQWIAPILDAIDRLGHACGKEKMKAADDIPIETQGSCSSETIEAIQNTLNIADKQKRRKALAAIRRKLAEASETPEHVVSVFDRAVAAAIRSRTVAGNRLGGRTHEDIREITIQTGLLQNNNGSALFTRGETQALVSATLSDERSALKTETLFGTELHRFMLHYNFPPFSVGEARPNRGPGRREIGHGNLALRALEPVLPGADAFPFTVRIVSDITESNGSSSMATVCGGTLAMINAGVPLKAPVAGIAMGLIKDDDQYVILSDILGDEDHLGDMDFKVAGTDDRVTAVQLDNKLGSLPPEVLVRALDAAKRGRKHILAEMTPHLDAGSSSGAPCFDTVSIPEHTRAALIGPGGKTIQKIQNDTATRIDIKPDGHVHIFGEKDEDVAAAALMVKAATLELKNGGLYVARVRTIKEFGAFVRIGGHEGLVHVSELAEERVDDVHRIVSVDDIVLVRVLGVDERGRLKISRRAALGESPESALNAGLPRV